ncbi:MAG: type II secretion system protein GspG [Phycisphaeraceae bacterium]|nr:type II secretion system protein GspG [Phycisphaeraceae bacterium]
MKSFLATLALCVMVAGCGGYDTAVVGAQKTSKSVATKQQMKALMDALVADNLSSGEWPTKQEGLGVLVESGAMPASGLEDPWGNPYIYEPPTDRDGRPTIRSMGPDQQDKTADDVIVN